MSDFRSAVAQALDEAAAGLSERHDPSEHVITYMKNAARVAEAAAVARVVETFARYEVAPLEKPGVGRYAGGLALSPALRFLITKPGDELDEQVRDKLEQPVCAAVGWGYAIAVTMEGSAGQDFKPRTTLTSNRCGRSGSRTFTATTS
jgi:hypothetical protein